MRIRLFVRALYSWGGVECAKRSRDLDYTVGKVCFVSRQLGVMALVVKVVLDGRIQRKLHPINDIRDTKYQVSARH